MTKVFQETINIAEGCQVAIDNKMVSVKGTKGTVRKKIFNPEISLKVNDEGILIGTKNYSKKTKKIINAYKAHINNLFKGVTEGHSYKLKICSGHFPMSVAVKNDLFEIKNFIGEKVPRQIKITEGTNVKVDGGDIIVESEDKEKAGQMAASIEQMTRRPGFDKRIFQDGIYLVEKDGKEIK